MTQITQQKGAADSNPSALKRWLLSRVLTHEIDLERRARRHVRANVRRKDEGRRHVVEYFHQADDGYSHLAIQKLDALRATYDIDLVVHLVPGLRDDNIPEPALLHDMSRWDAAGIAPYHDLTFPETSAVPTPALTTLALSILAKMDVDTFVIHGPSVSDCLWRGDAEGLYALAGKHGRVPAGVAAAKLDEGKARRAKLKHYSGATFYYEGEWYWGVDRLSHLEARLRRFSALRNGSADPVAPKPRILDSFPSGASDMTLEYYVSLRSPYTSISWEPTLAMAQASGIKLDVRPVLPMVMRGVPGTFTKGFYVWKDVAREAYDLGVEYGKFYDPVGEPVKKGYSLYMWALDQGRGNEFFGAFLKEAFAKGINTNTNAGLRKVVEMADLDWNVAKTHLDGKSWLDMVERNRVRMYDLGIWGVPSYRLLDRNGKQVLGVWGQDRLWLVSRKIAEHA